MTISNTPAAGQPRQRSALVTGFRRAAVIVIIVSLSLTALLGIAVLFTGGFGEVQGRILLTALLIAGFSITALCDLAVAGRTLRLVAFAGLVVSGIALVFGLFTIWWDPGTDGWGDLLRWFGIAGVWAVSLAQVNLLLLLGGRRRLAVRIGLGITIVFIALVALLITLPIATNGSIPGDLGLDYWRVFGVFVILDALGTIVVPVVAIFVRDAPSAESAAGTAAPGMAVTGSLQLLLAPDVDARLTAVAARAGTSRERVAAYAIAAHLDEVDRVRNDPAVEVSRPRDLDGGAEAR